MVRSDDGGRAGHGTAAASQEWPGLNRLEARHAWAEVEPELERTEVRHVLGDNVDSRERAKRHGLAGGLDPHRHRPHDRRGRWRRRVRRDGRIGRRGRDRRRRRDGRRRADAARARRRRRCGQGRVGHCRRRRVCRNGCSRRWRPDRQRAADKRRRRVREAADIREEHVFERQGREPLLLAPEVHRGEHAGARGARRLGFERDADVLDQSGADDRRQTGHEPERAREEGSRRYGV